MSDENRPQTGEIEQRSSEALEVDGRRVRGVIPYDTESRDLGGWKERISRDAFRQTNFDELRAVIDHKGVPLGRYPTTLQLEDRSDGLHWSLDPPKSRADVVEAITRRDMTAGSWRMVVAKDRWDGDTRTVEAISHLYDVTLVAAEQPAYPSSSVEYRSQPNPAEGQEEPMAENKADTKQDQQEQREVLHGEVEERTTNSGGINVESRVDIMSTSRPLFEELAVAAREVSLGEVRSLTTAISLAPPQFSAQFFDLLRPTSAFLRSGVRTLTTQNSSFVYPQLSADPTVSWVAEAGTITASDPTLTSGTAIPHKLTSRVEYSNELVEDSSPGIEQVLRQALTARAGVQIDAAAFEGSGASPVPRGMGNVAGVATVNVSTAATNVGWAGSAIATLETNNAPRPFALVGASNLWKNVRLAKLGTSYDAPVISPTEDGEVPSLYGATGYSANSLAGGTAYMYSVPSCYVVNRLPEFQIEVNRARLFDSDRSEMRLRMRIDYVFPYSGAIVRGTAVPA